MTAPPLAEWRRHLEGRAIEPGDHEYEHARRVWNAMIDKRPRLIVEAAGRQDIERSVALARTTGLPLAIRGGGHSVAGHGSVDDGIVLDLGRLRGIEVDPTARLVTVQAGATLGDVDRATQEHGLAVPLGMVSATGVAGLTLGGGVGWLTRRYGLTIDNLVSADVVVASGELVRASARRHADLFWGLRGGGGNFGVVSTFTFRAHPLGPEVLAGTLVYERPRWAKALRAYADWTAHVPDDISTIVTFMVPPLDWELGNRVLMLVGFAWAGESRATGEAVMARLRASCIPDAVFSDPVRWVDFQTSFDTAMPKGVRAHWQNVWFRRLDDAILEVVAEHCGAQAQVGTAADLHHMHGAFGRVPEDATAFPDRSAGYWLNVYGFWKDPADDAERASWVKGFGDALQPHAMTTRYLNFLGTEEGDVTDRALAVYGPAKLARLRELKRRYDPGNLFRVNHNITPAD